MMLCTLPNILVVQLKRFDFTASGARVKLTKSVKFAEVLDVSRFCWPDPEGCGPKVRSCHIPAPAPGTLAAIPSCALCIPRVACFRRGPVRLCLASVWTEDAPTWSRCLLVLKILRICTNAHARTHTHRACTITRRRQQLVLGRCLSTPKTCSHTHSALTRYASCGQYELYAVLVHEGKTMNCGHYYAYGRVGTDWFRFDDSSVSQVRLSECLLLLLLLP
jgi:hypothetical protein